MKKIYKYELGVNGDITTIKGPIEKMLTIQWQNGVGPVMWAIVDTNKEEQEVNIVALGTGWDLPERTQEYIGTIQDDFGYVWHYFTIKLNTIESNIEDVKAAYEDLKSEAFAVLAQSLGKMGVSAE